MSTIRLLIGTKKGAFILTSDGRRKQWTVDGPHFGGWELYHLKGSPADPDRIYASQTSSWFGQVIQRSDDGGRTWNPPGTKPEDLMGVDGMPKGESNMFLYDASEKTGRPLTTHQHYDGSQRPWEFKRVWHLEPSLTDPDTVYAGVEDAAIFKSTDGGTDVEGTGRTAERKRPALATGRRRDVPAYHLAEYRTAGPHVRGHLSSRLVSQRRCRADLAPHQQRADVEVRVTRSGRGCGPLRALHRDASVTSEHVCSCRNIGTCCAAIMAANRGKKSAATCRAISDFRSPCMPTNRRLSTSSPSKAILNTIHRKASCACTAARSVGMTGRH